MRFFGKEWLRLQQIMAKYIFCILACAFLVLGYTIGLGEQLMKVVHGL